MNNGRLNVGKIDIMKRLIQSIERRRLLWDTSCKGYSKKKLTDQAWMEVANELGKPKNFCKDKWKNLRAGFSRKLKKTNAQKTGIFKTNYVLYHDMGFLMPYCFPNHKAINQTPVVEILSDDDDDVECEESRSLEENSDLAIENNPIQNISGNTQIDHFNNRENHQRSPNFFKGEISYRRRSEEQDNTTNLNEITGINRQISIKKIFKRRNTVCANYDNIKQTQSNLRVSRVSNEDCFQNNSLEAEDDDNKSHVQLNHMDEINSQASNIERMQRHNTNHINDMDERNSQASNIERMQRHDTSHVQLNDMDEINSQTSNIERMQSHNTNHVQLNDMDEINSQASNTKRMHRPYTPYNENVNQRQFGFHDQASSIISQPASSNAEHPMMSFFKSILPDVVPFTVHEQRQFKRHVLNLIENMYALK